MKHSVYSLLYYTVWYTLHILYSFDLGTPISLQEAIFALDYIDHDFYVFRDLETNEINVVYKRNAGGIGLIQPQAWSLYNMEKWAKH